MAFEIDFSHDIKNLQKKLSRAQRTIVPKALNAAINTTARGARAEAAKRIKKEAGFKPSTGVKSRDIKEQIRLYKSNWKTLRADLVASTRKYNLIRWVKPALRVPGAARKRKGITVNPWNNKKMIKGAFVGNKGRTLFIRTGVGNKIRALHGPGIAREMQRRYVLVPLKRFVRLRFNKRIKHELERRLNKL